MALFKELKVPNIYTIESSFCGTDNEGEVNNHFTVEVLKSMGRDICLGLIALASQASSIPPSPTSKQTKPRRRSNIIAHSEFRSLKR